MSPEHPQILEPPAQQGLAQQGLAQQTPVRQAHAVEDEATRLLSAAAHADDEFADAISKEYLQEPRRAVPPSSGLNSATVLREAVKALHRRLWRDGITLVLFLLALLLWPQLLLLWLVVAVIAAGSSLGTGSVRWMTVPKRVAVAGALLAVLIVLTSLFFLASASLGYFWVATEDSAVPEVLGLLAVVALLGVLIRDQWYVRQLLATTFNRALFHSRQHTTPYGEDRIGSQYAPRLAQIAQNSGGNLIVHDGYRAFVGYGQLLSAWSMVMHLRKEDEDTDQQQTDQRESVVGPPVQLDVAEIHRAVSAEVLRLRGSEGLAPGFRLRELTELEQVVISSTALLQHRDSDSLTRSILPALNMAPRGFLTEAQAHEVATGSREWIRSYRGYQVDSWDRDLVVTAFLRISCGDGVLYLEWSLFRLNPISQRYRWELWELASPARTLLAAVVKALGFPFSLPSRIMRLSRAYWLVVRSAPKRIHPEVYGARNSIREIAAENEPQTYFQDVDTVRYLRLLEERLLVAVRRFLERAGLSTEDFDQQRATVLNSTVINGGQFSGVNVVGQGNQIQGNRASGNRPTVGSGSTGASGGAGGTGGKNTKRK